MDANFEQFLAEIENDQTIVVLDDIARDYDLMNECDSEIALAELTTNVAMTTWDELIASEEILESTEELDPLDLNVNNNLDKSVTLDQTGIIDEPEDKENVFGNETKPNVPGQKQEKCRKNLLVSIENYGNETVETNLDKKPIHSTPESPDLFKLNKSDSSITKFEAITKYINPSIEDCAVVPDSSVSNLKQLKKNDFETSIKSKSIVSSPEPTRNEAKPNTNDQNLIDSSTKNDYELDSLKTSNKENNISTEHDNESIIELINELHDIILRSITMCNADQAVLDSISNFSEEDDDFVFEPNPDLFDVFPLPKPNEPTFVPLPQTNTNASSSSSELNELNNLKKSYTELKTVSDINSVSNFIEMNAKCVESTNSTLDLKPNAIVPSVLEQTNVKSVENHLESNDFHSDYTETQLNYATKRMESIINELINSVYGDLDENKRKECTNYKTDFKFNSMPDESNNNEYDIGKSEICNETGEEHNYSLKSVSLSDSKPKCETITSGALELDLNNSSTNNNCFLFDPSEILPTWSKPEQTFDTVTSLETNFAHKQTNSFNSARTLGFNYKPAQIGETSDVLDLDTSYSLEENTLPNRELEQICEILNELPELDDQSNNNCVYDKYTLIPIRDIKKEKCETITSAALESGINNTLEPNTVRNSEQNCEILRKSPEINNPPNNNLLFVPNLILPISIKSDNTEVFKIEPQYSLKPITLANSKQIPETITSGALQLLESNNSSNTNVPNNTDILELDTSYSIVQNNTISQLTQPASVVKRKIDDVLEENTSKKPKLDPLETIDANSDSEMENDPTNLNLSNLIFNSDINEPDERSCETNKDYFDQIRAKWALPLPNPHQSLTVRYLPATHSIFKKIKDYKPSTQQPERVISCVDLLTQRIQQLEQEKRELTQQLLRPFQSDCFGRLLYHTQSELERHNMNIARIDEMIGGLMTNREEIKNNLKYYVDDKDEWDANYLTEYEYSDMLDTDSFFKDIKKFYNK